MNNKDKKEKCLACECPCETHKEHTHEMKCAACECPCEEHKEHNHK